MKIRSIIFTLFIVFNFALLAQDGIVKTYYSKDQIESELSFINNIYEGTSFWYYPNGNLKEEKTFDNGKLNGPVVKYYENGLVKEEFYVRNGVIDGIYRRYYDNGALAEVKKYEMGALLSSQLLDKDMLYEPELEEYRGTRKQLERRKKSREFLCNIEICPQPAGGMKAIYDNLIYPEHAKMYGLEGRVMVVATIDTKGDVAGAEVYKGLGLGTDEAAIEAVRKTKFLPGQDKGRLVESQVTLNIEFKLDRSEPEVVEKYLTKSDSALTSAQENITEAQSASKKENRWLICDEADVCPFPEEGLREIVKKVYIPGAAKRAEVTGDIVIKADIDELGYVISAEVIEGLGYGLDSAALTAIYDTRFRPAMKNGEAVPETITLRLPVDTTK